MRVDFGTPEHGWLTVTVASDDTSFAEDVSDVGPDSLQQLVWALERLAKGSSNERVEWFLEPALWVWRFDAVAEWERSVDTVAFHVEGPERAGVVARTHRSTLIHTMVQALAKLEAEPAWRSDEALDRIWNWEFPSAALARLLANEKTKS